MNGDTCDWCGEFLSNGYDIVEGFGGILELCPPCKKEHDQAEQDSLADEIDSAQVAIEAYCGIYGGCRDCD